jgi:hypothetical protein
LFGAVGGVAGAALAFQAWKLRKRRELFELRYGEGRAAVDEVTRLADRRFYALQRYFWALEGKEPKESFERKQRTYFKEVMRWNNALRSVRNKLLILVGETTADLFLDYRDDVRPQPLSLHYRFVSTHQRVQEALNDSSKSATARQAIQSLNHAVSRFAETLALDFVHRTKKLDRLELDVPGRSKAVDALPQASD